MGKNIYILLNKNFTENLNKFCELKSNINKQLVNQKTKNNR